jgi:rfaE bifunctional protein nucleotidyltransferase chain/domain/rfaE bifunctional protein kinase chain/domain
MTSDTNLTDLIGTLSGLETALLRRWGVHLAVALAGGSRLLVVGNGGSAAQAQQLAAELVGRFRTERTPLPVLALSSDTSTVTAIGNDYGLDEVFARQVIAHGRAGDVLLALSASGRSANVLAAVSAATSIGMTTWALTGQAPNPLAQSAGEHISIPSDLVTTVQECHLVAIHMLCEAVETAFCERRPADARTLTQPTARAWRYVRLTVVGDVLLDEDITGSVERVSPEAPVVVVGRLSRSASPGGAGFAAMLAAREGHEVTLVTSIADDDGGRLVRTELANAGVSVVDLPGGSRTAVKTRVRSAGQTLLMLDGSPQVAIQCAAPAPREALDAIRSAEAIHVADYGRGVAAMASIREAIAEMAGRAPVIWDPHPLGSAPLPMVTLVTPSSAEARHLAGEPAPPGLPGDVRAARALTAEWGVGHAVVTRGECGAVLVSNSPIPPIVVPAPFKAPGDARGAGDRFAVAVATAMGAGASLSDAVRDAVSAASSFVAGTATAWPGEVGEQDAMRVAARVRAANGTVVATGGCFDVLHCGHVAMLKQARQLGDCLIVCVNDDASVRRLKGEPRPLATVADRVAVLGALECVDAVAVFGEDTPEQILSLLRPDLYVKGGDYAIGELPEQHTVESAGGQVVLVPYLDGHSTSSMIRRVQVAP